MDGRRLRRGLARQLRMLAAKVEPRSNGAGSGIFRFESRTGDDDMEIWASDFASPGAHSLITIDRDGLRFGPA